MTAVRIDTLTKVTTRDPSDYRWWRAADGFDHAFRVVGAWMSSACPNKVRWTAALVPAVFGPTNPCYECQAIVNPESEQRALDGNR